MTQLYKIINGELTIAPESLIINEQLHSPVNETTLMNQKWKPLKKTEYPTLKWYEKLRTKYEETENNIVESYEVEPLSNLRDVYSDIIITELNRSLENDFIWGGHVVKMSESNQKDYLASFCVATRRPDMLIPMEYTFKNNIKYMMQTLDELESFTNLGLQFVSRCLDNYRSEKDNIDSMTDDQLYNYVKAL